MPLISVVIPVHAVADYLDRCLDSVLAEPGGWLEVVAVDDASPDRCGDILAARGDPRLRVVRTGPAGGPLGPGPARELGARHSTGEYLWFVDGDDELAPGALPAVAAALRELRPEVLVTDFEYLYPDGSTSPSGGARYLAAWPPGQAGPLAAHPALINVTMTLWSRVFRRDFLAGLPDLAGPAPHEDVPVTALGLLTAAAIGVLDRVCYRYRRSRRGSYLSGLSAGNFNIFGAYEQVFAYLDEPGRPPVTPAVRAAVFERAIWHFTTLLPLVPPERRREFFRRMTAAYRRWRPPGTGYPPGWRGVKFGLVARGAYPAYRVLEPVNRVRLAVRPGRP